MSDKKQKTSPPPDSALVARAAQVIRSGGLVGLPTRHAYGIGADALNLHAIENIFTVKGRPENKPILTLISDPAMLEMLAKPVSNNVRHLLNTFWPGGLTVVLPAQSHLPPPLTAQTGKVGIRLTAHPLARALIETAQCPITGTSANLSGQPPVIDPRHLRLLNPPGLDLILDGGVLPPGPPSTVVDASGTEPLLLREGQIAFEDIRSVWES